MNKLITVYSYKTRSCSTSLLYLLSYSNLKFKVEYLKPDFALPEPTATCPFPQVPYIIDSEAPHSPVHGLFNSMVYVANKAKMGILLPNDILLSEFL